MITEEVDNIEMISLGSPVERCPTVDIMLSIHIHSSRQQLLYNQKEFLVPMCFIYNNKALHLNSVADSGTKMFIPDPIFLLSQILHKTRDAKI
jgi:hypothetical protein